VSEIVLAGVDGRPEVKRCPACDASGRATAFTVGDWDDREWEARWSYVRCTSCGSVFADPQPSNAELEHAYGLSYGPYEPPAGLLARLARPLVMREAKALVAAAPAGSLALDVGCGPGQMLERIRAAGWTGPLRGIEPNAEVARATSTRVGVQVDVAPVEALPGDLPRAGLIVLRHVIEHVREPLAVLEALSDVLEPNGVLYVGTPDARALSARAFGRHWHGWDPPRHLAVMPRDAVRTLLARAGLELVQERWDWAPQMWMASLQHRVSAGRAPRYARPLASHLNPLVGLSAALAATVELAARRTTMYGVLARRAQ
jgi:SAM-dependent methyltransferase